MNGCQVLQMLAYIFTTFNRSSEVINVTYSLPTSFDITSQYTSPLLLINYQIIANHSFNILSTAIDEGSLHTKRQTSQLVMPTFLLPRLKALLPY